MTAARAGRREEPLAHAEQELGTRTVWSARAGRGALQEPWCRRHAQAPTGVPVTSSCQAAPCPPGARSCAFCRFEAAKRHETSDAARGGRAALRDDRSTPGGARSPPPPRRPTGGSPRRGSWGALLPGDPRRWAAPGRPRSLPGAGGDEANRTAASADTAPAPSAPAEGTLRPDARRAWSASSRGRGVRRGGHLAGGRRPELPLSSHLQIISPALHGTGCRALRIQSFSSPAKNAPRIKGLQPTSSTEWNSSRKARR